MPELPYDVLLPPARPANVRARRTPAVRGRRFLLLSLLLLLLLAAPLACGGPSSGGSASGGTRDRVLTIGAIPDQDPEKLQRLYGTVAEYLSAELGVEVRYRAVTDYTAAVSLFRTGDLQMVWFGGLTGVQARQQTPGSIPVAQRDIDGSFHSLFLGHTGSGLRPVSDVAGLAELKGRRFTFGSRSSTSGYLMPASFLLEAGIDPEGDDPATGFAGRPGYSGSHDKTIDLVTSGSFDAGVVNEQVWKTRLQRGTVDTSKVEVLFRTPAYADYHWLVGPTVEEEFGPGFAARIGQAFFDLDAARPSDAAVLDLFGARQFVPTTPAAYDQIEATARRLGLLTGS
jgi:phosphonate transport system substrate-binding protein